MKNNSDLFEVSECNVLNIKMHKVNQWMEVYILKENIREASVVMAKCRASHRTYGIRIERKMDNVWHCTWAFQLTEKAGSNEGYGNTMISGRVEIDSEYPGCPYCGGTGWVSCGSCGKLTCDNGEDSRFTCAWCRASGELQMAETFDLSGGGY